MDAEQIYFTEIAWSSCLEEKNKQSKRSSLSSKVYDCADEEHIASTRGENAIHFDFLNIAKDLVIKREVEGTLSSLEPNLIFT